MNMQDIATCIQDGPLLTPERFSWNAFYGGAHVLKMWAGIPEQKSLNIVVPHGAKFNPVLWGSENSCGLRRILFPYETTFPQWEVVVGALPFVYALQMVTHPKERHGTVFMPAHSTEHIDAVMDHEAAAENLLAIPEWMRPVDICLYWKDVLAGRYLPYEERGLKVVTVGHMFRQSYLLDLARLFLSYRFCLSNELGSHTCYALLAGCGYQHVEGPVKHVHDGNDSHEYIDRAEQCYAALFQYLDRPATEDQMDFASYYTGANFMHSPERLRELVL